MKGKSIFLVLIGIIVVAYTAFFDLITGKGQIILGPKSYIGIALGVLLIIWGLVSVKKK